MREEKKKKKDKTVEEIHVLDDKVQELEEKLLRNQAELMNFKRRKEEETSRMLKYSDQEIVIKLLPIIDNFERAVSMEKDKIEDVSKFLDGFEIIHNNLQGILKAHEVIEIEAMEKQFDPTVHQAVLVESDKNKKDGIVLEVLQKGYMLKDRIIRPTMVKVNKIEKGDD